MRKIMITIVCALLLTACDVETSDNGQLDGFWLLERVENAQGGQGTQDEGIVLSPSADVYWGIQHRLLNARSGSLSVVCQITYTGDSLLLGQPYLDDRDYGDAVVTDVKVVQPLGIHSLDARYAVRHLTASSLVIADNKHTLHFRALR